MSLINTGELGNMLIGAFIGELSDIHTKNEATLEASAYPTIVNNTALTFATTSAFDISHIRTLIPSSRTDLSEFQRTHINMKELVKTRLDMYQFQHFLKGLASTDTLDVYGILINLGSDKRLNPLHPLVAQAISTGVIRLPDTFEVIIYPMTKEQKISQKGLETNVTAAVSILNFTNENGQTAREVIKPKNSLYSDINNLAKTTDPLNFTVEFQSKESSTMRNVITPVQFASDGVVTPYYGIIQSEHRESGYRSQQLSPMLSGNIQTGSTEFGTTCTGDLSSSRYSSLHVLNGLNLNSAYFKDTVSVSSFHWIKACQLISIEILCAEPEYDEKTEEKE